MYGCSIARVLGGISVAFIMPGVTAYVADITSIQERPKAMGYLSAISTGFIIGPGIGGFIAEYGIRVPFFVANYSLCSMCDFDLYFERAVNERRACRNFL